jgi:Arabinose-binding domain of AraC transcription regulator, N-term
VRTANLRGFLEFVGQRNGDPSRILNRFGLEPRALADPDVHMSCQQFVDILEYCSVLFDDPLFGLRFGQTQDADVYGPVAALCRAAPDMRSALRSFVDFLPVIHSPDATMELAYAGDMVELRWTVRSDLGVSDQANFQALALNLKLLQMLASTRFQPTHVRMAVSQHACRFSSAAERGSKCHRVSGKIARPAAGGNRSLDLPVAWWILGASEDCEPRKYCRTRQKLCSRSPAYRDLLDRKLRGSDGDLSPNPADKARKP